MLNNYLKISWRNILKDKGFTIFNIVGLAIGMSVALIIGLWVYYQFSYDRFLPGYRQVYRVMNRVNANGEVDAGKATCLPLATALKNDIPGIQYVAQADWMGQHSLVAGDTKLYIAGAYAGEDFLKIFRYPLLAGDASQVLHEPASIVLTQSTATALFGTHDPINRFVRLDNQHNLKVSGVIADVPPNSSLQFKFIIPFSFYIATQDWIKNNLDNWNLIPIQTFVALQPGVTQAEAEARMHGIVKKYDPEGYKEMKPEEFLHPLKDWHLYDNIKDGVISDGFISYVRLFIIISILVLLIACINFTNLSTVRSERRAREVGVRKAVGSHRQQIIIQFLIESLLITFIAFVLALCIVSLALPAFNTLTDCAISIPWNNGFFWGMMCLYMLGTGLAAGSRPAFYLSSFKPVEVLKGSPRVGKGAVLPRKILVVLQFTCSIAFIISTIIVYQQIQYVKGRPKGYDGNRVIITDASTDLDHNYIPLKEELLQTGMVLSVTKATAPVTALYSWTGIDDWQGKIPGEALGVATVGITDDYFRTVGMQFAQGRNFWLHGMGDSLNVILNEAAVKRMRFKDPVGQLIHWNNGIPIRVIGVVKDALMQSPFSSPDPTFFVYNNAWSNSIMYKLTPSANASVAIKKIAAIFEKYNPFYPFTYHFADENYAAKFKQEMLISTLSGIFAALAIFISCLGLLGLAAYEAQQRTKEIGIRKVLGASVMQVLLLLSKEFIILVLISCLIASPIAFYFLQHWLQDYDYRIHIGPGVFIASGIVAIIITVVTISFQTIKAALMNPVKSLRTE
jgi:putative ABC transport system permease protein